MMDGWGWWGPGVFFRVFCMVMMAWMMMGHGHGADGSHTSESYGHKPGEAERILAERLARGEIDVDEYERRLSALRGTTALDETEEVFHDR